jgi:acetylornithine deacetylase/succinyl-diaminopimelate desuccinylase-like protein
MNFRKIVRTCLLFSTPFFSYFAIGQNGEDASQPKKITLDKRVQNETTTLSQQPVIKSAFQTIIDLEPETLKDHITLTEIPAPPFKEQKRAEKYREMLQAIGVDTIWIDKAGNVIALRKGKTGKKTVVIEAHLDTVFPEGTDVTVKHKGDTLLAPGIADDTRGLVVVSTVLKAMQKNKIITDADILFVGTTGEEGLGDLRGVKQLFNEGNRKIDSYISIDGSGMGSIIYGGVGSHRYRVTYKGPGGHSFGSFGLANPHNASARAIHYFINDADTFTKKGIKTTYNIGMMGGGTSVNAIPFESWMEVDMRSENAERLAGIDKLLQAAILRAAKEENQMKRSGPDLTVDVQLVGDRPSGVQDLSLPLLQKTAAAYSTFGTVPHLGINSTNANIPISKGVPAVNIGSGGKGGRAHSTDEWWVNDRGYLAIQHALLLLISEAGLAK